MFSEGRLVSWPGPNSLLVVILCFHVLLNCFGRVLCDIRRIKCTDLYAKSILG